MVRIRIGCDVKRNSVLHNPSASFADKSLRRFRSAALTVHRTVIHYRRHRFANPLHKGALASATASVRWIYFGFGTVVVTSFSAVHVEEAFLSHRKNRQGRVCGSGEMSYGKGKFSTGGEKVRLSQNGHFETAPWVGSNWVLDRRNALIDFSSDPKSLYQLAKTAFAASA